MKGSPSISSTNWLRDDGPRRSADDPPVLVGHDPRGALDLACGFDLSHDTGALQMPRPVTRGIQHRLREYRRDCRPKSVERIESIVVKLRTERPCRGDDDLVRSSHMRDWEQVSDQYFVRCCLVTCPEARTRSSQRSGSRSPRRVECSGELHIRCVAQSSAVRESLDEAEGQGAAREQEERVQVVAREKGGTGATTTSVRDVWLTQAVKGHKNDVLVEVRERLSAEGGTVRIVLQPALKVGSVDQQRGDALRRDRLATYEHISVQDERYDVQTRGVMEWRTHSVGVYRVYVEHVQSGRGEPLA